MNDPHEHTVDGAQKALVAKALYVLTGIRWEVQNGEIVAQCTLRESLRPELGSLKATANVHVARKQMESSEGNQFCKLRPGYNGTLLIQLAQDRLVTMPGGMERIDAEWEARRDRHTSRDPQAVEAMSRMLKELFPAVTWTKDKVAIFESGPVTDKAQMQALQTVFTKANLPYAVEHVLGKEGAVFRIVAFNEHAYENMKKITREHIKASPDTAAHGWVEGIHHQRCQDSTGRDTGFSKN